MHAACQSADLRGKSGQSRSGAKLANKLRSTFWDTWWCLSTPANTSSLEKRVSMPKVLIVDDDEEIRSLLAEFLSDIGCPVRLACDGVEALEILRQEGGWVIFLDWNMPRLDGAGVIEQLADHAA